MDGGVLREDRDALLALEVTGVHGALVDVRVGSERAGLVQHRVDEGGLTVVDVGDDRDVTQVGAHRHRETHFTVWKERGSAQVRRWVPEEATRQRFDSGPDAGVCRTWEALVDEETTLTYATVPGAQRATRECVRRHVRRGG